MRASTAYFAGAGTVIAAIVAGVGGGLVIADMISPKSPKQGTELSRLGVFPDILLDGAQFLLLSLTALLGPLLATLGLAFFHDPLCLGGSRPGKGVVHNRGLLARRGRCR